MVEQIATYMQLLVEYCSQKVSITKRISHRNKLELKVVTLMGYINPRGREGENNLLFGQFFMENCMKMKEIGWGAGGGVERVLPSPLDQPMLSWKQKNFQLSHPLCLRLSCDSVSEFYTLLQFYPWRFDPSFTLF